MCFLSAEPRLLRQSKNLKNLFSKFSKHPKKILHWWQNTSSVRMFNVEYRISLLSFDNSLVVDVLQFLLHWIYIPLFCKLFGNKISRVVIVQ